MNQCLSVNTCSLFKDSIASNDWIIVNNVGRECGRKRWMSS